MKCVAIAWRLAWLGVSALWAADGTWTGVVDGAWSATANWSGGTVASGSGSVATLSNLTGPIRITNDVSGLTLKGLVAAGGAYTVVGQPLTLDGTASGNYGLVVSGGSQTVANAVKINATASQVYVANGAGLSTTGPLDYLGNNTLTKRGDGEWLFSGSLAETNSSAYFYVVGGTFRLTTGAVFTELGGGRLNFCVGSGFAHELCDGQRRTKRERATGHSRIRLQRQEYSKLHAIDCRRRQA